MQIVKKTINSNESVSAGLPPNKILKESIVTEDAISENEEVLSHSSFVSNSSQKEKSDGEIEE